MNDGDKAFFIGSLLVPLCVWWYFSGRKRYGMKGMK